MEATALDGPLDRQHFIGGSDARVIMGGDEDALIRLWQEKRGEAAADRSFRRAPGSARARHRGAEPGLVRAQLRPPGRPPAVPEIPPLHRLDGGHLGRLG